MEPDLTVETTLKRAQDNLAEGKSISTEEYAFLNKAFSNTTNNSKCPCGSAKKYSDCCKREWLAVERGQKKLLEEAKEERKEKINDARKHGVVDQEIADKDGNEDTYWIAKLGYNKKTKEPVLDLFVTHEAGWDPLRVTKFIRTVYQNLYDNLVFNTIAETQRLLAELRSVGMPSRVPNGTPNNVNKLKQKVR